MFPSSELLKVSSVASEGVMTWWRVLIHKESNVKCVSTTERRYCICLAIRKKIFHKKFTFSSSTCYNLRVQLAVECFQAKKKI